MHRIVKGRSRSIKIDYIALLLLLPPSPRALHVAVEWIVAESAARVPVSMWGVREVQEGERRREGAEVREFPVEGRRG